MDKPAIEGGAPVRDTFLPYGRQVIDDAEKNEILEVLASDWITTGPRMRRFEQKFREEIGVKHALAVNSGTAALHVSTSAISIKPGDEVITTPLTFVATSNAVIYRGGTPVLADIQPDTYNIDPERIKEKITRRTKAIIPVHFAGHPCDMDEILEIAEKNDLRVIEDAAHAVEAFYKGKRIGTLSDLSVFSFHPVKNITTAEGGMVTTNNDKYASLVEMYRTHGITKDAVKRFGKSGGWYYEMQRLGLRYNMSELHAALGIHQLDKLPRFQAWRRKIVEKFNRAFSEIPEVTPPVERNYVKSGWHLYVIRLELDRLRVDRDQIFKAFRAENIGVNVHYIPVHHHPYYKTHFKIGALPVVDSIFPELITLPFNHGMNDQDVEDVIMATEKIISFYKS
jgi:UDP-4-amino-4,6-dideoxy-N-acetyl-beta-L-altrosamine transaminase